MRNVDTQWVAPKTRRHRPSQASRSEDFVWPKVGGVEIGRLPISQIGRQSPVPARIKAPDLCQTSSGVPSGTHPPPPLPVDSEVARGCQTYDLRHRQSVQISAETTRFHLQTTRFHFSLSPVWQAVAAPCWKATATPDDVPKTGTNSRLAPDLAYWKASISISGAPRLGSFEKVICRRRSQTSTVTDNDR